MSARTYDLFALDKPTLALGEVGEWTLGDFHDERAAKVNEILLSFSKLDIEGTYKVADYAALVGKLAEAVCENAEGLADIILDRTNVEKYGDEAVGVRGIDGLHRFLREWIDGEISAGNG